jgi:hypothetical protein
VVCYRCQVAGHLAKACPQRFDVRLLTPEEKREYAEAFMAELDLTSKVEESPEAVEEPEPQDFHDNNG